MKGVALAQRGTRGHGTPTIRTHGDKTERLSYLTRSHLSRTIAEAWEPGDFTLSCFLRPDQEKLRKL
jgi:hypothetical protein